MGFVPVAAAAGIDVICEKPIAVTLKEAHDILALSEQYGIKILVAENFTQYVVSACMGAVAWAFGLPYFQSVLADLDKKGSVAAAGSFSVTIGEAIGPALGASQTEGGGYTGVILIGIALYVISY